MQSIVNLSVLFTQLFQCNEMDPCLYALIFDKVMYVSSHHFNRVNASNTIYSRAAKQKNCIIKDCLLSLNGYKKEY